MGNLEYSRADPGSSLRVDAGIGALAKAGAPPLTAPAHLCAQPCLPWISPPFTHLLPPRSTQPAPSLFPKSTALALASDFSLPTASALLSIPYPICFKELLPSSCTVYNFCSCVYALSPPLEHQLFKSRDFVLFSFIFLAP